MALWQCQYGNALKYCTKVLPHLWRNINPDSKYSDLKTELRTRPQLRETDHLHSLITRLWPILPPPPAPALTSDPGIEHLEKLFWDCCKLRLWVSSVFRYLLFSYVLYPLITWPGYWTLVGLSVPVLWPPLAQISPITKHSSPSHPQFPQFEVNIRMKINNQFYYLTCWTEAIKGK